MGEVIKADFNIKLSSRLQKFDRNQSDPAYHAEIFHELYPKFPQFKAHVAAYVERHYCTVINDEDHPTPQHVLNYLQPDEISWLNEWILTRGQAYRPQPKKLS